MPETQYVDSNLISNITGNGEKTMPLQPAFFAYLGTTDSNVTGDGTTFQLGSGNALTEAFDSNGDFNTNGTFTAPIDGRYLFLCSVEVIDLAAGHTSAGLDLTTTSMTISFANLNPQAMKNVASGSCTLFGSLFVNMSATDTATFSITVVGGAKTVDVRGTAGGKEHSCISGFLFS